MVQLVTDIEPENQLSLRTKEYHMPYVNVHGVNLYYEEYGKGPAVLLTPAVGWTGTGCVPWLHCWRRSAASSCTIAAIVGALTWLSVGSLGTAPVGRGDG